MERAKAEGDEVPPVPIGMYVDGVPYLKRGHFVALWVYNLLTGVRHVIVVFKKETLCQCGCRAWCTLWHVFTYFALALSVASVGIFPELRGNLEELPKWEDRRSLVLVRIFELLSIRSTHTSE